MLIQTDANTFTAGPADILCIFRLPAGTYHVAFLEEKPMPGPIVALDELSFIRLKSKMHHTVGAATLEGAQVHLAEMRTKITINDTNVVADAALDMDDPVSVIMLPNWIAQKVPLKEVFGLPEAVS